MSNDSNDNSLTSRSSSSSSSDQHQTLVSILPTEANFPIIPESFQNGLLEWARKKYHFHTWENFNLLFDNLSILKKLDKYFRQATKYYLLLNHYFEHIDLYKCFSSPMLANAYFVYNPEQFDYLSKKDRAGLEWDLRSYFGKISKVFFMNGIFNMEVRKESTSGNNTQIFYVPYFDKKKHTEEYQNMLTLYSFEQEKTVIERKTVKIDEREETDKLMKKDLVKKVKLCKKCLQMKKIKIPVSKMIGSIGLSNSYECKNCGAIYVGLNYYDLPEIEVLK